MIYRLSNFFSSKDLPEGAAFSAVCQETKDNLPACKLRVSLKSAADQIWEDYNNGKLVAILKKNLLSGMTAISSHLRMRIDIMKEEYERACFILAGKTYFRFSSSIDLINLVNFTKEMKVV